MYIWRIVVCLGPQASSELANGVEAPPTAVRRVGVREILDVPSFAVQVGYLASMQTDACSGYSIME